MNLVINDKAKIKEIQDDFNRKFEYLRLEFYTQEHRVGEATPASYKVSQQMRLGDIKKKSGSNELSINGNLKVSTLENHFREYYGLNVQVFRKSANVWLQTTKTDDWTLSEQNKHAYDMEIALRELEE